MKKIGFKMASLLSLFAIVQIMCSCGTTAQVTAYVYEDLNGNGIMDGGETWLPGISLTWSGNTQASNKNGEVYFPAARYANYQECRGGNNAVVQVPTGYELTQNGFFGLDCDEAIEGLFYEGGSQYSIAFFGLHPIPVTETPTVVPAAQPTATPQPAHPAITLVKSVDHTACSAVNEKFIYTYTFTNTGDVPLTGFTLTDDKIASFDCPQKLSSLTLPPGKSATCYGAYFTSPQELKTSATIHNQASASSAYLGQTVTSSATADVYCKAPPPPVETEIPTATPEG